ncbi:acyl-CoA carboxylase epsilon subunit [Ornithinimicrobium cryptoxanthini]|uniref:acyl-CoA carboxylase epsilon subunit n=1 Tax=Ornithinimicrobium cryptoxanthini TaxID=2934161 RepID=UPI0021180202|nr:acyl-CoA carboxylase epsilon subunit [Ornithinimicrobium cryptoxanthini]
MSADATPAATDDATPAAPPAVTDAATEEASPVLRVVSGNPTPEEVAALMAVLAAAGSGADTGGTAARRRPSLWSASARTAPPRPTPGHGAWRASGLPH